MTIGLIVLVVMLVGCNFFTPLALSLAASGRFVGRRSVTNTRLLQVTVHSLGDTHQGFSSLLAHLIQLVACVHDYHDDRHSSLNNTDLY